MTELKQFAGAYFHQDFDLEYAGPDAAIADFRVGQGVAATRQLISELRELVASGMTDEQLERMWIWDLGGSYEPKRDGMTYRQWFGRVIELLSRDDPS